MNALFLLEIIIKALPQSSALTPAFGAQLIKSQFIVCAAHVFMSFARHLNLLNIKCINHSCYHIRKSEWTQTSSGEMMSLKLSRSSWSGKTISHVFGRFSSLMSDTEREQHDLHIHTHVPSCTYTVNEGFACEAPQSLLFLLFIFLLL